MKLHVALAKGKVRFSEAGDRLASAIDDAIAMAKSGETDGLADAIQAALDILSGEDYGYPDEEEAAVLELDGSECESCLMTALSAVGDGDLDGALAALADAKSALGKGGDEEEEPEEPMDDEDEEPEEPEEESVQPESGWSKTKDGHRMAYRV